MLLYAAFIAYQSLADGGAWVCGGDVLAWPSHHVSRIDVLANVLGYVPLGWLCAVTASAEARWRGRRISSMFASVALVSLFSLALEMAQSCQTNRVSSATDWATNSAGAALGAALALILPAVARAMEPARAPGTHESASGARLRVGAMSIVMLWVLAQTMPWAFTADVGTFARNLAFLRHWQDAIPLDRWNLLRHFGAWLALVAACRLAASSRLMATASLFATVAGCLALQVMLAAPSPLTVEELVGVAAAIGLAAPALLLMPYPEGHAWWPRVLLTGVVMVVATYELRPAAGGTHAFSWIPLVGLGQRLGALDFAALFAWAGCGVVVAAHTAQRQRDRAQARRWPLAMLVLVLALELAQTRIPGRGPDTSAVLFTILAMLGTGALLRGGR
ncbi:putative integral membrane protein [Luteitalea pratensis]|uniref:Putative integral membrane protein n=1 Tax=Luteitalea pratensis TaxID=1855912 RepID=A0A143PVA3_LUTPR|nr:putative integral membrane protein [Luteitalea pratensis]